MVRDCAVPERRRESVGLPGVFVVLSIALCACSEVARAQEVASEGGTVRREIDTLNRAMVAAFERSPASVAAFYADEAAIIGGGQRHVGREAIDEYWRGGTMFTAWALEAIETGGPKETPWQYGRSVLISRSGRRMETYFIGLMKRESSGELKFHADIFVRGRGRGGEEDAARLDEAWVQAMQSGNGAALADILSEAFVMVTPGGVRDKGGEIAGIAPRDGVTLVSFQSIGTESRGFGPIAITTGALRWKTKQDGVERETEQNYASVAIQRDGTWRIVARQVSPRG